MKKCFQSYDIKQQVKVEENMFDYKITFSSILPQSQPFRDGKKNKDILVRYDSNLYRAKAKILDYAKNNVFNYFVTITIDSKKYDLSNYEAIRKVITDYFKVIKKRYDNDFKYIIVAELGKKHSRLHFHCLVYMNCNNLLKHIKNGMYRNEYLFNKLGANNWKPIKEYNLQCALYVVKYMEKDNSAVNLYSRYYFCSKGLKSSKNITFIFDSQSLEDLFKYCCYNGLLHSGSYCDTIIVNRDFILTYLKIKNDLNKVINIG